MQDVAFTTLECGATDFVIGNLSLSTNTLDVLLVSASIV